MLSTITTHTAGVNWESVGVVVGSISGVLAGLCRWANGKIDKHRQAVEDGTVALNGRLDALDDKLDGVNLRVARLEGPEQRRASAVIEAARH